MSRCNYDVITALGRFGDYLPIGLTVVKISGQLRSGVRVSGSLGQCQDVWPQTTLRVMHFRRGCYAVVCSPWNRSRRHLLRQRLLSSRAADDAASTSISRSSLCVAKTRRNVVRIIYLRKVSMILTSKMSAVDCVDTCASENL